MLVILGIFLVAALWRNKDLADATSGNNKEIFTFLVILSIILICRGTGFILSLAKTNKSGLGILVPISLVFAAIGATANGPVKTYATIAGVSLLSFMILNFV